MFWVSATDHCAFARRVSSSRSRAPPPGAAFQPAEAQELLGVGRVAAAQGVELLAVEEVVVAVGKGEPGLAEEQQVARGVVVVGLDVGVPGHRHADVPQLPHGAHEPGLVADGRGSQRGVPGSARCPGTRWRPRRRSSRSSRRASAPGSPRASPCGRRRPARMSRCAASLASKSSTKLPYMGRSEGISVFLSQPPFT